MYSSQSGWVGSLNYLEPGKGYMFYRKRSNDTAFYYPAISGSLVGGRIEQTAAITNPDQRPVAGNYSNADNMTIIATVAPDFDFRSGDSILAYVNGEIRGKAKPILNPQINRYTYFFNVGGQAEQSLVFMIERSGSIVAQSNTIINYSTNTIVGTLAKPLELHFVKEAAVVMVYPNPFNNITNISVDLRGLTGTTNHEIQMTIVDVAGRTVLSRPVQKVSGTGYNTTWNGRNTNGTVCGNGVYFIKVMVDGAPHIYRVVKQ
ncbi:MAG: T9SS type A sorting domain-containing protein, partial [Bacteroidota bacterium]|nr:T9SS type A sorting domain-containing protein [Bacteroidota bacterium]